MPVQPTSKRDKLLTDPALAASVHDLLRRRGIPEADRDDLLQVTLYEAHRSPKLPDDSGEWPTFTGGIARRRAISFKRLARHRREAPLEEAGEVASAVPADPASTRDLIEKLTADTPKRRWPLLAWFARMSDGESLGEIARKEGVDYDVAYKRVTAFRRELRQKTAEWGVALVVALLVGGAWYVLRPRTEPAQPVPQPVPTVVEPTPEERAQQLRVEAYEACGEYLWGRCEDKLDEAQKLDPAGEDDPRVQSLRRLEQDGQYPDRTPDGP